MTRTVDHASKLRKGLAKGLLYFLTEANFLDAPQPIDLPRIVTAPQAEDATDLPIPEDDLVEKAEDESEVSWSSVNYLEADWTRRLSLRDKLITKVTGKFLQAPPVAAISLPVSAACSRSYPASHLDIVRKACGSQHQIELVPDSGEAVDQWIFKPFAAVGRVPVIDLGEVLLFLDRKEEKIDVYALTVESYQEALKPASDAKPSIFIVLETNMLTLAYDGLSKVKPNEKVKGWLHEGGDFKLKKQIKDSEFEMMVAESYGLFARVSREEFSVYLVTTAPEEFAKQVVNALGFKGLELVCLHDAATHIEDNKLAFYAKDVKAIAPNVDRYIILDNNKDTWPEDQRAHILPQEPLHVLVPIIKRVASERETSETELIQNTEPPA